MSQKMRMFNPNRGGKKVPELVRFSTEHRIRRYAEENFAGRYTRLEIRFRGQFCYVDAYREPNALDEAWPPADWPQSREQYLERLRNTPIHLCRLRYFGEDRWGFAFFSYANSQYELSVFPSGDFLGTPEVAFHVSAEMYLRDF